MTPVRIIGYTYEAAMHCPACTAGRRFAIDNNAHPHAHEAGTDEHGVHYNAIDTENLVHPVFSTDETEGEYCDGCFVEIAPPWNTHRKGI